MCGVSVIIEMGGFGWYEYLCEAVCIPVGVSMGGCVFAH